MTPPWIPDDLFPPRPGPSRREGPAPFLALAALLVATPAGAVPRATSSPPSAAVRPTVPERILAVLDRVRLTLRTSRYDHDTRVDERTGRYDWDCSAMAAWVLRRAAPEALATIDRGRPVAMDFYRAIRSAPVGRSRGGWQRVARVADARPGDVLAWARPRWFPSHNTGHVAFLVGTPEAVPEGYLLRIADSTSVGHEADTRAAGQSGYGEGTLLITTDPVTGAGTGYGWMGRYTGPWVVPTPVAIGRVGR